MRACLGALAAVALSAPVHANWHRTDSPHFIIYADQDAAELRDFTTKLEKFDKAVRLVRAMPDPALTESNKLTIFVLRDIESVGRLAGSAMVAGFYVGRASGSVAVVPRIPTRRRKDVGAIDSQTIFFHEYAHHLHLQNSGAALPGWLVEGLAEFFSTATVEDDGSVVIGRAANHRAWALFNFNDLSLEEMLAGTYKKLTAVEWELLYGRGWLLAHYLTFEPSRAGQLTRYVEGIQSGRAPLQSARQAFGDLKALDKELTRYLRAKTLRSLAVSSSRLTVGAIRLRPLSQGEILMLGVRLRSERGVDPKSAPGVASDARRIAAKYPDDSAVQVGLAEAEIDAQNFAAAAAAADRALALAPQNIDAMIFKGRARMELARRDPTKADWKGVRSWLTKANRLDPDNAEPLMLFYQSYLYAGAQPTRNAIAGLLYAADIVPHDDDLRLLAVRQLLADRDLAKAKTMFAPLAFNPHASDKWRDAANGVMVAIASGNADLAATALTQALEQKEPKDKARKVVD